MRPARSTTGSSLDSLLNEGLFNGALAEVLRELRPDWEVHAETTRVLENSGKRPDILVLPNRSPALIFELSFDQNDAEKDAKKKLGQKLANDIGNVQSTIAVHIPSDMKYRPDTAAVRKKLREGYMLSYALYQMTDGIVTRWPESGMLQGTVADLSQFSYSTVILQSEIDRVGDLVANSIEVAAKHMKRHIGERKVRKLQENLFQRSPVDALKTTMLFWLDSLLTQQRLYRQNVGQAKPIGGRPDETLDCWKRIRERNWHSIFDPAIEALSWAIGEHVEATSKALSKLFTAVKEIEMAYLGERIEVGAEIYPRLTADRKTAAAFYTLPATAEFLAFLTVCEQTSKQVGWGSPTLLRDHKLGDLACGTGTLLRAGYKRVLDLQRAHLTRSGVRNGNIEELHKDGMEYGLVGADISPIAAHLTTTSLSALGDGDAYGNTNIGWIKVGGPKHSLGSLDYFTMSRLDNWFVNISGALSGGVEGNQSGGGHIEVADEKMDWILMNPPYSRTRIGQSTFDVGDLDDKQRKGTQKRLSGIAKKRDFSVKAGLGAAFLILALNKVRRGGTIGFVLPLTAAFADTWKQTRRFIENECVNIIAVSMLAGRATKESFSADTGMEEMLLIATRKPTIGTPSDKMMRCITLRNPIRRVGEASEVAKAVRVAADGIFAADQYQIARVGDVEIGHAIGLEVRGKGKQWEYLSSSHYDLAICAKGLSEGKGIRFGGNSSKQILPMTTIGKLFDTGPTHHLIGHMVGGDPIGIFELHEIDKPSDYFGSDRSLWRVNAKTQRRLIVNPTHKGVIPKSARDLGHEKIQKIRESASYIHYCRYMRWTSNRILVATTKNQVLGGVMWNTLGCDDEGIRAAFGLWANSTLGMLVHWTQGGRQHPGRSIAQIAAIKEIPCPDFATLCDEKKANAIELFESFKDVELKPACLAHDDSGRIALDIAVLDMLDIGHMKEAVDQIRLLWCSEPSVHGGNRTALKKLDEIYNQT